MAQHPSAAHDDVVEWGTDDQARPSPLGGLSARLRVRERHLTTAIAATGAGLAGLSLLVHWQVTAMSNEDIQGRIETGIAGLEAWGSGYLLGLMGLLALTATTLYGAPALRQHTRLAGLGWAAGLLGMLVATAANLSTTSIVLRYSDFAFTGQRPQYELSYGPGLYFALAGVAALTAALYLGDRSGAAPDAATRAHEEPVEHEAEQPPGGAQPAGPPPATTGPTDLTVSPTTPFVHLPEPGERW